MHSIELSEQASLPHCWNLKKIIYGKGKVFPSPFSGYDPVVLNDTVIPPMVKGKYSLQAYEVSILGMLGPDCGLTYTILSPLAAVSGITDLIKAPFSKNFGHYFASGLLTFIGIIQVWLFVFVVVTVLSVISPQVVLLAIGAVLLTWIFQVIF